MADTKISALTAGGTAQSTDLFPIARGAANFSVTPLNIMAVASPTLTTPALGVATATSINKLTLTAPATGATLTLADGSTFATSGAFSTTLTVTGATTLTLPTSGTVTALGNTTTGSGSIVLATSPSLTTPTLGVASATSINKLTLTAPATGATLTLADGSTFATSGAFSTTFTATGTTTLTLPTSGTVTALGNTTTGSGNIVLATSPTLTTPALGVATGTSIALNGATIGSNSLAVTGPTTLTESVGSSALTLTGATQTGATLTGVTITGTAGQFSCNAASPALVVGQLLTISGTFGGTGSITGYTNPTSYYVSATNGSTTFTLVSLANAAIVTTAGTPTGLTYAYSNTPVLNASQTWNSSTTPFQGLLFNAAGTSSANSAASSLLMDLQIGGTSVTRIGKAGNIQASGNTAGTCAFSQLSQTGTGIYFLSTINMAFAVSGTGIANFNSTGLNFSSTSQIAFTAGTVSGTTDTIFTRRAAANIQLGAADATNDPVTPAVAQKLTAQGVATNANNSNRNGYDFTIQGSASTGTGTGGKIIFQVTPPGSAGSTQNNFSSALTIDGNQNVYGIAGTTGMTNGFFYIPAAAGAPSGTPATAPSGTVPMYYDTTNNNFYVYNGAWKKVALA